jgi:hypothetical protein
MSYKVPTGVLRLTSFYACVNDSMLTDLSFSYLVPIGRSQSDGLAYHVNPRFDDQGRWRRRADWPTELR